MTRNPTIPSKQQYEFNWEVTVCSVYINVCGLDMDTASHGVSSAQIVAL